MPGRDPLVVWHPPDGDDLLLDGHNRLAICEKHRKPYKTEVLTMATREEAADWIDANQLGRRNLTPDQRDLLLGRRYNRAKRKDGGHGDQKSGDQNDTRTRLIVSPGSTEYQHRR